MDNMDFNNLNNLNQNEENTEPKVQEERITEKLDSNEINMGSQGYENFSINNSVPEAYEEAKSGYISIQNVPAKKHRFRKAASYVAAILISAIVGGAAGGAYVNHLVEKDEPYTTPITASQNTQTQTNTVAYTPPTSLIGKIAADVGPAIVGVDTQVVSQSVFGQQAVGQASGSGIIYDKRGYIVTNQHVIDGAKKITVTLPGGKQYTAQVIGADPTSDLAVLKINASNLPVAPLGDSSTVRVGDLAVAIGNPMGEEYAGSVTSGIISALNRTIDMNDGDYTRRYKLIQTDAAINPGNSGGALINQSGEVIGINSIKFVDSNVEGMGFAIPINDVKTIVNQLMQNGYVSRPYLGVSVVTITSDMAQQYNCPAGVGIDTVGAGTAAAAAGLKPGDVVLEADGVKMATNDEFVNELQKHKVGDSVKLKIWRDGKTIIVPVTLGENKGQSN